MSKELSEQQKNFLEIYFQEIINGNNRHAAARYARDMAGYSENTHPYFILRALKEEIINRSIDELAMMLPQAVRDAETLLIDPGQTGARGKMDAIQLIMDRAGLVKKDKLEVQQRMPDGVLILPPKNEG